MSQELSEKDLRLYVRASLKAGITYERLLEGYPQEALSVAKMALFLIGGGRCDSLALTEARQRLEKLLETTLSWLSVNAETLELSWLKSGLARMEDNHLYVDFSDRKSIGEVLSELEVLKTDYRDQRLRKRQTLIEKNRTVNARIRVRSHPDEDRKWMQKALEAAASAARAGEVPVGAVLVLENQSFVSGNAVCMRNDPTAHAEMEVIRSACAQTGSERLAGGTLYVTLEPCPMCAAAIAAARVSRVVWGAEDRRCGAMAQSRSVAVAYELNHRALTEGGVLEDECQAQLRAFFENRRQDKDLNEAPPHSPRVSVGSRRGIINSLLSNKKSSW